MLRIDAMKAVYPELEQCVVVTIMGAVSAELQSLGHRPHFFYLLHAMGLASSMGLGIALCRPEKQVVVLDGDGSILMNLGGLTTLARYRPKARCVQVKNGVRKVVQCPSTKTKKPAAKTRAPAKSTTTTIQARG